MDVIFVLCLSMIYSPHLAGNYHNTIADDYRVDAADGDDNVDDVAAVVVDDVDDAEDTNTDPLLRGHM